MLSEYTTRDDLLAYDRVREGITGCVLRTINDCQYRDLLHNDTQ